MSPCCKMVKGTATMTWSAVNTCTMEEEEEEEKEKEKDNGGWVTTSHPNEYSSNPKEYSLHS